MKSRENHVEALHRWRQLEAVQKHYANFDDFLTDGMELLGFRTTWVQYDIAEYIVYGPQYSMVQAQRGQAKTTITAIYAVWSLLQNPTYRVLVLSAGGTQANEISTLIVRMIMTWDLLECMRPDRLCGDRTSVEAFDLHHSLKGIDKSPSVACVGITGNLQGKRADLLIADDIESTKNGLTATMREQLRHLTLDFTSICSTGKILYLGTPQSQDSIYNTLPSHGFTVRVWPGRYPSAKEREAYGDTLAPSIIKRMEHDASLCTGGGMLGDQGQPVDTVILGEEILQKKQLAQGASYFQLQHMLNTALSDEMRYPLKTQQLIVMHLDGELFPLSVTRGMTNEHLVSFVSCGHQFKMRSPHAVSQQLAPLQGSLMYIDPAGGGRNADESGWAVTGFLNSLIFLRGVGGVVGGYDLKNMQELAKIAQRFNVQRVIIEKNMGYGAFREVFIPVLRQYHPNCGIEDDYVTGQKELRIVNTLEAVIGRGALMIDEACVKEDEELTAHAGAAQRRGYSFFWQLAKLTRDSGSLIHDDRLDAVEGAVRPWVHALAIDQAKAVEAIQQKAHDKFVKDPLLHNRYKPPAQRGASLLSRFKRT